MSLQQTTVAIAPTTGQVLDRFAWAEQPRLDKATTLGILFHEMLGVPFPACAGSTRRSPHVGPAHSSCSSRSSIRISPKVSASGPHEAAMTMPRTGTKANTPARTPNTRAAIAIPLRDGGCDPRGILTPSSTGAAPATGRQQANRA